MSDESRTCRTCAHWGKGQGDIKLDEEFTHLQLPGGIDQVLFCAVQTGKSSKYIKGVFTGCKYFCQFWAKAGKKDLQSRINAENAAKVQTSFKMDW